MWTIGYIHYITNKIAYITYSHVDQDIPYQLKCDKGSFHAWDIIAVGLQEHIYNGIANYDIIDIIKIQNFDISLIEYFYYYQSSLMNIAFNNFVTNSAHPTFRVMQQSCCAYSLRLKHLSFLKPYSSRFITLI